MKRVTRSSSRPKDAPSAEPEVAAKKPAKPKPAKKVAAAAKIDEEVDENVNVDLPGTVEVEVQKNGKKAAVDKKKVDQAKSDDIQEESDAKKPTAAGKKRAAPAKKSAKSDDDDEEQSSPAKKPKSTAAAAKKTAKKPKSSEEDEDEEMPAKVESPKKKNDTKTDYGKIQFESSENFNFKIATWNVAGLRALANKNADYIDQEKPDVICFNEIKCTEDEVPDEFKLESYPYAYWNIGKGFGGVGMLSKVEPLSIVNDIPDSEFSDEKRMITAEFEKFYLISVYVVNAGRGLKTLDKRLAFNEVFDEYVQKLDKKKPVIIAGDMNVSHQEIDLANPKSNKKSAGFTEEERAGFDKLLSLGFVDTFRELYPDQREAYTFWSYMAKARAKNVGWRLDYFLVSQRFTKHVKDNIIRSEVMGSDHCPIVLLLSL